MAERWVNAVIRGEIPLDVSPDASDQEKLEAAVAKAEAEKAYIPDGYEVTHETVSGQPHSNPQGQGDALLELIVGVKDIQDSLAFAWSQTDPERPAANLREMVRSDEANLGALVAKAEASVQGQGEPASLDTSCPTCGALPSERTQFDPAERAELLSALFAPEEVRKAVAERLLKGGSPGQGECDGSGEISQALREMADSLRATDDDPDVQADADLLDQAAGLIAPVVSLVGCPPCRPTDTPSQPDAPSVPDQFLSDGSANEKEGAPVTGTPSVRATSVSRWWAMRERLIIAIAAVLYVLFYPLIWLAKKLSKEGPGWGD